MLTLRNISYSYHLEGGQSVRVLDGINLVVERGDFLAIQGPSGSGKSTLLYLLGCLQRVQKGAGSLELDGADISRLSETELAFLRSRKIGFVFQQFHLLARASVIDNILLPTLYPCELPPRSKNPRAQAEALAAKVGLSDRLDHLPNQLSGGQQQRVAIARALMNEPELILADEPTGNLDSKSSAQIMELLRQLNAEGKTVVLITHDSSIAAQCKRVVHIRDGKIVDGMNAADLPPVPEKKKTNLGISRRTPFATTLKISRKLLPSALDNLRRNRIRTLLTMLGITIGIGAVFSMITLGEFTKKKILDSYSDLGVNTVAFYGYPNWSLRASDVVPNVFRGFDWEIDLLPLRRIFPEIQKMSPVMMSWEGGASYAGRTVDNDVRVLGVNEDGLALMNREFASGRGFNSAQLRLRSPVCVIGYEIAEKLFKDSRPVGSILNLTIRKAIVTCRVLGVLKPMQSNKEWMKPNTQVFLPYTFFQVASGDYWSSLIHQTLLRLPGGGNLERTGNGIRAFFEAKYGKSGMFRVDSDSLLVTQMSRFLTLFSILLAAIAMVCLAVGGIGIANMMLVSVSERYREIGLRKALGATPRTIRTQFLLESLVVCAMAGLFGLLAGFAIYETGLWAASKLVNKVQFEWVLHWGALALSCVAILFVGIASGLFPALKAERMQVVEALRSE